MFLCGIFLSHPIQEFYVPALNCSIHNPSGVVFFPWEWRNLGRLRSWHGRDWILAPIIIIERCYFDDSFPLLRRKNQSCDQLFHSETWCSYFHLYLDTWAWELQSNPSSIKKDRASSKKSFGREDYRWHFSNGMKNKTCS